MKFNLKLISLILILLFISVSAVCAEDVTQTADSNETLLSTDNIDETGTNDIYATGETASTATAEPKEFYELTQQIWRTTEGSTIELDIDYINLDKRPGGGGITIDRTITIDGKGHTLDGNNLDIFYIQQGKTHVTLKNIIFINGKKDCGGAIFADERTDYLTVDNCTFINNQATTKWVGGAILANGNYATITNNRFENNVATGSGGAIRIEGDFGKISNNTFTGNKAIDTLGGAICAFGHNIQIINNIFTKNMAGRDGGAICIEGTHVAEIGTGNIVSNNVFISNTVAGNPEGCHGGAISMAGENCKITNNNFTNNHAANIGGAIRWNGADSNMGDLTGNIFKGNDAPSGGAVYISGHGINIAENIFDNNQALTYVGGSLNIKGNSAKITNNNITNSKAKTSGGAIYAEGANTQLTDNVISKCSAGSDAGGAYIYGDSATIANNQFVDNTAKGHAGAALIKSNNANINSNEYSKNTAGESAGAIFLEGLRNVLKNNKFIQNHASTLGGAIRWNGGTSTAGEVSGNKFEGNDAQSGGAIYAEGTKITITKNNFNNNKATKGAGGSINLKGNSATISNSNITNSASKEKGGGAYLEGSGSVTSTSFINCTAETGGGIYSASEDYTVSGNTFKNNTAKDGSDCYPQDLPSGKQQAKVYLRNALYFVLQTKIVQVTLWDAKNNPIAGKTVYINLDEYGLKYSGVTDKEGNAYIRVGVGFGNHPATVSFEGDDQYKSDSKTGRVRVIKETPSVMVRGADTQFKVSDNPKIVKVYLWDRTSKPLPVGSKIFIKVNGQTFSGTTDDQGIAHVEIKINNAGTFNAQVIYAGNSAYNAVTRDIKINIFR